MDSVSITSRSLRTMGILAVDVRGMIVHPECRTLAEVDMTVRYVKTLEAGAICPRCGALLSSEVGSDA